MTVDNIKRGLFALATIGTIRAYTAKKRVPFLGGLLDDLYDALMSMITHNPKQPSAPPPESFQESIVRVLTFLIEESLRNNRPDISKALHACHARIQKLPRNLH